MQRPRRLIIECSATYYVGLNTGIQRVVRNLIVRLPALCAEHNIECLPVVFAEGHFFPIPVADVFHHEDGELPGRKPPPAHPTRAARMIESLNRATGLNWNRFWPFRILRTLIWAVKQTGRAVWQFLRRCKRRLLPPPEVIRPGPDDLVLCPDAFWSTLPALDRLNRAPFRAAPLFPLIHDLLPITRPDLFDQQDAATFCAALPRMFQRADGYLTTSQTGRRDLKNVLAQQGVGERPIGVVLLGADLHSPAAPRAEQAIRPEIARVLESPPTFLVVGTIEPRKNHDYLLDSFERLWKSGATPALLCLGRTGWLAEKTVARIRTLQRQNRPLHWFADANDTELAACYQRTQALILASQAEGFGLPLVEAMHYNLPAIVSDIPIFHELGGDYPQYVDLRDSTSLAAAVQRILDNTAPPPGPKTGHRSWDQAARDFYDEALRLYAGLHAGDRSSTRV